MDEKKSEDIVKETLDAYARGVKCPPDSLDSILPVSVVLHGYGRIDVVNQVEFSMSIGTEIDLSVYYPNLNYTLKLCENVVEEAEDGVKQND